MSSALNLWIYILFLAPLLPVGLVVLADTVTANADPSRATAAI